MSELNIEELIATLALDDIQEFKASRKGKSREDAPLTDEEVALDIQAENLKALLVALQDKRIALSIDEALHQDTAALNALSLANQGELDDHLAALALESGGNLPFPTHAQRFLETYQVPSESGSTPSLIASVEPDSDETDDESFYVPHGGSQTVVSEGVECVICRDPTRPSHRLSAPCSHYYCRGCLLDLVEASTRDETLHPLRCCRQPLPVANIIPLLPLELNRRFRQKSTEFRTPPNSRLYCPNQTCSTFLGSSSGRESETTCTNCNTRVCSSCKNRAHPGENCAEHTQTLVMRSLASEMNWQTCPGCHAIVELSQGCYHITCRCSTQFCYLCAAQWKTCDCRQWDDQRLLNDAERRVQNQFGAAEAAARPAVFEQLVHRMIEELEDHTECDGHEWRFRRGGGVCEECYDHLPTFLMCCRNCQVLVCKRCSVNRL